MTVNIDAGNHPAYHPLHVQPVDLAGKAHTVKIRDVIEVECYNQDRRAKERKIALLLHGWAWYLLVNKTNNATLCGLFGRMTGAWVSKSITITAGRAPSGKATIVVSAPKSGAVLTSRWPATTGGEEVNEDTGEIGNTGENKSEAAQLADALPGAVVTELDAPQDLGTIPADIAELMKREPANVCKITAGDAWREGVLALAQDVPHFAQKGGANFNHALNTARKLGYRDISASNIALVLADLRAWGLWRETPQGKAWGNK